MKNRIALFAHYDRDGLIDDYVVYYLQGLNKVAQRILFVSNCELADSEAAKLQGLAELVSAHPHNEFDFGSWKRAFEHIHYNLSDWDEVIIANDSCYGPITPLSDMFTQMASVECDFWSANAVIAGKETDHLSAYFVVFKSVPGMQKGLQDFFSQISNEGDYWQRIENLERGLSRALWAKGFQGTGYVTRPYVTVDKKQDMLLIPFVKIKALRYANTYIINLIDILRTIEKTYPRQLIDAHMKRMIGTSDPAHYHRKVIGYWQYDRFGITVTSKLKRNLHKKRKNYKIPRYHWWKVYAYLLGIPFFAFVWPVRNPTNDI